MPNRFRPLALIKLAKLSKRVPLRTYLIVPFVLQIIAVVGVTGYLSYHNGQEAVRDLVSQLEREVGNRIEQRLKTYLETSELVNQINADAVRLGLLDLNNMQALEQYLWHQFQQFNDQNHTSGKLDIGQSSNLTFIALATNTGDYIGMGYRPSNRLIMDLRDQRQDSTTRVWRLNDWGSREKIVEILPDYDPRGRPWYKRAIQVGKFVWVEPYLTEADKDLIISADQPLYDRQGNLVGVTDATLSLAGISDFLGSLKVGKTQTFIIEPSGQLIATSTGDLTYSGSGQDKRRLNALNSPNPIIRMTANHLQQAYGSISNINGLQEFDLSINGERQFVKVQPFRDDQGLDWLVVIVVPELDFMAKINENSRNTALLCLLALAVAIALGVATSRWLTTPILQLSQAAEALASGNWNQQVAIQRPDELRSLAYAFNHMRKELQQSHQQLEEYSRGLEQKNEQLRTLEAELRRQLNLFLHAVSHDLRNPVIGTSMVLNNLNNQAGDELVLSRKILERMIDGNQRQLDLINSLIDTHAAEMWGIALHPEPNNLHDLVQSAIADLHPMLEREKTVLTNQIASDLPQVNVDPLQLARVYQNLLANALKHNPPGLHITLDASLQGDWIRSTVSDNGVGISPEQCEKLFDPYFRGNPKPKSVGLGLGLYLCQQIIHEHGGEIGVESQLGAGTSFWFTLPVNNTPSSPTA